MANDIQLKLLRSSNSVAANYRSACHGRSKVEFLPEIGISLEVAYKIQFYLEIIKESGLENLKPLKKETGEITVILTSSRATLQNSFPLKN